MDLFLLNDKNIVRIPAGLMLLFCAIPVQMIITFYEGDNYMTIVQLCFGYMWLWFLGLFLFWNHMKIIKTTLHRLFWIYGLIFNGLFILFLPYIFSDAFTDLFW